MSWWETLHLVTWWKRLGISAIKIGQDAPSWIWCTERLSFFGGGHIVLQRFVHVRCHFQPLPTKLVFAYFDHIYAVRCCKVLGIWGCRIMVLRTWFFKINNTPWFQKYQNEFSETCNSDHIWSFMGHIFSPQKKASKFIIKFMHEKSWWQWSIGPWDSEKLEKLGSKMAAQRFESSWWFQPIWKIFVKLDHFFR